MKRPTVIFVMGHPASGKTTLAKTLGDTLSLPVFGKDVTFKEPMFDAFDTTSREWSIKIGRAAFTIMKAVMEQQLKAQQSFIVESTFKYEYDNPLFQDWQEIYNFQAIQVVCQTDPEVLVRRYHQRIEAGERHPGHGHFDEDFTDEQVKAAIQPFSLDGAIFEINTNTFSSDRTTQLIEDIRTIRH